MNMVRTGPTVFVAFTLPVMSLVRLLVTMITSSAIDDITLIARYTNLLSVTYIILHTSMAQLMGALPYIFRLKQLCDGKESFGCLCSAKHSALVDKVEDLCEYHCTFTSIDSVTVERPRL